MEYSRRSLPVGAGMMSAGALTTLPFGPNPAAAAERQPLKIPPLIDARTRGNAVTLRAQADTTEFFPGFSSS